MHKKQVNYYIGYIHVGVNCYIHVHGYDLVVELAGVASCQLPEEWGSIQQ